MSCWGVTFGGEDENDDDDNDDDDDVEEEIVVRMTHPSTHPHQCQHQSYIQTYTLHIHLNFPQGINKVSKNKNKKQKISRIRDKTDS